ncbi:hypothetical protein [Aporhodopirellula aestuarii]|uniref:Secreted protein n=1 Tax=Aporhodopirellula aestuarii TaxID=2950107 RepID=A0ABT0U0W6_9BACT|nr:hypothetical protein [Aporhodopirellula aestuarii]MCM2370497.1 hypothetical protein [Aporhodopirellula aestuarii]
MRKNTICLIVWMLLLATATAAPADELLVLDNGQIRIGIDREKGASITWLSTRAYPKNMVNLADPGRLIQQSYYAGVRLDRTADGQHSSWNPWSWNPIQGGGVGSWAVATTFEKRGEVLYSETIPKLWDMPNEAAAARMRQWTSLEPDMPNVVSVRCEFQSMRDEHDRWGPARLNPQELPACYFTRNFANVKSYLGEGQWRTEQQPPGPPWGRAEPPLDAMACLNDANVGIAVYSPASDGHWNFGPHGKAISNDSFAGPCMHVAPLGRLKLGPKTTFRYRYWLVLGDESLISNSLDALIQKYADETIELEN